MIEEWGRSQLLRVQYRLRLILSLIRLAEVLWAFGGLGHRSSQVTGAGFFGSE
jgi:hypothetical protein